MIDTKNPNLTLGIKDTWKKCFLGQDPRWTEYFFQNIYQPNFGYAVVEEDKVVASLCRIPHAYMYNGRVLQASLLSNVAILGDVNQEEKRDELINRVLDACEHTELITLLASEQGELFEKYGFEKVYGRNQYKIERGDITSNQSVLGCAFDPSPVDMLKVYVGFIRRFTGFYARDLDYFTQKKKEMSACGGKIVAYYNAKNRIQGYAIIRIAGKEAYIDECVYLESTALLRLIHAALQERGTVYLNTSSAENLSMLLPNASCKEVNPIYARLNDASLFSRLYNRKVTNVKEAFAFHKKPLNLNEKY